MDVFEAIRKRRSVRSYTGDPIPVEHLEQIVDAGRWAASGNNRQPWTFVVVTDKAMLERFCAVSKAVEQAAAVIAVVMDDASQFWLEDASAAVENMLLASTALGYGSCWLEGRTRAHEQELKGWLGIPAEKRLMTLVSLGVPVEWPEKEKKSLSEVLRWERYSE